MIIEIKYPDGVFKSDSYDIQLNAIHDFTASELLPKRFNFNQEKSSTSQ